MSELNGNHSCEIFGLILARKGSKGIPGKNMRKLNGIPLVVSALCVMKQSKCFAEVWVSTDDDDTAKVVEIEGGLVHRRQPHTATDEASSLLAVQEFLENHSEISNICLVQCTSPFLKEIYLQKGAETFQNNEDFGSVFAVTRKHLLRWSGGENMVPLNFDVMNKPRRQDYKGDLCENGMFYFSRKKFITEGVLQGGRCSYVEIPEEDSVDIDTPMDLFIAEQIIKFRNDHP